MDTALGHFLLFCALLLMNAMLNHGFSDQRGHRQQQHDPLNPRCRFSTGLHQERKQ